ncbi:hypothetical protein CU052_13165 [Vibrio harveyi]|nr:hypothetical protein CU052_13165 [Vibrio harveyi]
MTSLLMKPTSAGKDTRHKRDQPLKKLAYVSNHWGPLLKMLCLMPSLNSLLCLCVGANDLKTVVSGNPKVIAKSIFYSYV